MHEGCKNCNSLHMSLSSIHLWSLELEVYLRFTNRRNTSRMSFTNASHERSSDIDGSGFQRGGKHAGDTELRAVHHMTSESCHINRRMRLTILGVLPKFFRLNFLPSCVLQMHLFRNNEAQPATYVSGSVRHRHGTHEIDSLEGLIRFRRIPCTSGTLQKWRPDGSCGRLDILRRTHGKKREVRSAV